jgi:hypothetical protein
MKTPQRIGIFILAIAISLFLASLQRAYTAVTFGVTGNLQPNEWHSMARSNLLGPQSLKIMFSTTNGTPINLYLLNTQELQEWQKTSTLNPTISIQNLSTNINTYDIPSRDFYTILAQNPNPTTEGIAITLTLYGFEKDLLLTIGTLTIAGLALLIPPSLFKKQKASAVA